VRRVPMLRDFYKTIGELLLQPACACKLAFFRCDAFDVVQGEKALKLSEAPLEAAAAKLLIGVLRHNRTVTEVDLTAADLEPETVKDLGMVIEFNDALTSLSLGFNPGLDAECKSELQKAIAKHRPEMRLVI